MLLFTDNERIHLALYFRSLSFEYLKTVFALANNLVNRSRSTGHIDRFKIQEREDFINLIDHIDGTKEKSDLVDQVNEILRTNADAFNALLDLGAIVADPEKPQHAKRDYLGGDRLHFNEKGGNAVADAVDLDFFAKA